MGEFTDITQPQNKARTYGRAWKSDLVMVGHSEYCYIIRGGDVGLGSGAGTYSVRGVRGEEAFWIGFRPTIIVK